MRGELTDRVTLTVTCADTLSLVGNHKSDRASIPTDASLALLAEALTLNGNCPFALIDPPPLTCNQFALALSTDADTVPAR